MIRLLLELWFSIPAPIRYIIAAVPVCLGVLIAVLSGDYVPALVGSGISLVLWLFINPSEAEKKGYHF